MYVVSSGYLVSRVRTHDDLYDFEYALNVSNSLWVPPGPLHSFRNVGDVPAVIIGHAPRPASRGPLSSAMSSADPCALSATGLLAAYAARTLAGASRGGQPGTDRDSILR